MMMGYVPFEVENKVKILAVWPHGKYVEEMIDFLNLNNDAISDDILIIGDTNSNSVFNNHHPMGKNHYALIELLRQKRTRGCLQPFKRRGRGKRDPPNVLSLSPSEPTVSFGQDFCGSATHKEFFHSRRPRLLARAERPHPHRNRFKFECT